MDNYNKAIVAGLSAQDLVDMLNSNEAEFAAKALNYFDGKQEQEMVKVLSHPDKGRKDWKRRGYIARHRNLTKMIVEKSGMLFKDSVPQLEVRERNSDGINVPATEALIDMLDGTEWQEVMLNLDSVVRLLKTAVLLVQWDETSQKPVFDILHRANCNVVVNPFTKGIDVLIQRTGMSGDQHFYRVWTAEVIIDLVEQKDKVHVVGEIPNTYGSIPAVVFYDTTAPRAGFWVEAPHDLINVNEMYNLHLTDSEFTISWMKRPSPVTNCTLDGYGESTMEVVEVYGSALPRSVASAPKITAGPDSVIMLGSSNGESPMFEYKAPVVDIKSMDEVVQGWVKQTAADWSVRVRADGEASATSGFQLVVEEAPNLELRQTRQRMFEAGFKRLYRTLVIVAPIALPETAQLFTVFAQPSLPVDHKAQEDVWSVRIKEGRATEIDYYMEVHGLSKDEALEKWLEVVEFRNAKTKALSVVEPAETVEETDDNEDEQPEDEQM